MAQGLQVTLALVKYCWLKCLKVESVIETHYLPLTELR